VKADEKAQEEKSAEELARLAAKRREAGRRLQEMAITKRKEKVICVHGERFLLFTYRGP